MLTITKVKSFFTSHYWWIPFSAYAVLQGIAFAFLHHLGSTQQAYDFDGAKTAMAPMPADPSYNLLAQQWDGQWYRIIAEQGYPEALPVEKDGTYGLSALAFYPLFPTIVRAVMAVTTLPFGIAGAVVASTCTLTAVILFYRLLYNYSSNKILATSAILTLLLSPAALILQVAYTEGLSLLLLITFFTFFIRKKYVWALVPVLLLGFTRTIMPALSVFLVLWGLCLIYYSWLTQGRKATFAKASSVQVRKYVFLTVGAFASALFWPITTALITGSPTAYTDAYGAWFNGYSALFSWWALYPYYDTVVPFMAITFTVLWIIMCLSVIPASEILPPVLRLWTPFYAWYVFVVTHNSGGEYRYILPALLILPFSRLPSTRRGKIFYGALALIALAVLLFFQYHWIRTHWLAGSPMHSQLP